MCAYGGISSTITASPSAPSILGSWRVRRTDVTYGNDCYYTFVWQNTRQQSHTSRSSTSSSSSACVSLHISINRKNTIHTAPHHCHAENCNRPDSRCVVLHGLQTICSRWNLQYLHILWLYSLQCLHHLALHPPDNCGAWCTIAQHGTTQHMRRDDSHLFQDLWHRKAECRIGMCRMHWYRYGSGVVAVVRKKFLIFMKTKTNQICFAYFSAHTLSLVPSLSAAHAHVYISQFPRIDVVVRVQYSNFWFRCRCTVIRFTNPYTFVHWLRSKSSHIVLQCGNSQWQHMPQTKRYEKWTSARKSQCEIVRERRERESWRERIVDTHIQTRRFQVENAKFITT